MEKEQRLNEFRDHLISSEKSDNTIASYCKSIELFYRFFDEFNRENVIKYKDQLSERYKPKTISLRLMGIGAYADFMGMPECKVKTVKICNSRTVENVISMQEYHHFLNKLLEDKNYKTYYIIKFLAQTGCRASELVGLEKDCLRRGECVLYTKGKYRRILIPRTLVKESRDYFATVDSKYLFPNKYGEKMSSRGVYAHVSHWGQKYGIKKEVLHPHSFRHFFAINFLKKNKNIALLADILGHESIATTAIYLRLSASEQKRQFNRTVNW